MDLCELHKSNVSSKTATRKALGYIPYFELGKNWMDGRVVEGGGLENRCGATHRGFESLSIRMC